MYVVASAALAAVVLAEIGSAPVPAAPAAAAKTSAAAAAAATTATETSAAAAAATAPAAAAETTSDDADEASASARVLGKADGDRRQQRQQLHLGDLEAGGRARYRRQRWRVGWRGRVEGKGE